MIAGSVPSHSGNSAMTYEQAGQGDMRHITILGRFLQRSFRPRSSALTCLPENHQPTTTCQLQVASSPGASTFSPWNIPGLVVAAITSSCPSRPTRRTLATNN